MVSIWPWTPIHRAVVAGDSGYVRGWLDATFDLAVTPEHVTEFITLAHRSSAALQALNYPLEASWPTDWRMWFEVRLEAAGYFSPGGGRGAIGHLTVELHTGFLYLVETEEMLAALRKYNGKDDDEDGRPVGPSGCAEPGIERTARKIRGVDSLARRVAPTDWMEN